MTGSSVTYNKLGLTRHPVEVYVVRHGGTSLAGERRKTSADRRTTSNRQPWYVSMNGFPEASN